MNPFALKSKLKNIFAILIITLFITGCSFFEPNKGGSASVSLQFPEEVTQKITAADRIAPSRTAGENPDDTENAEDSEIFIEISLKGGYEATQTVLLTKPASVTFTEIPTGIEVWAEALIYKTENNEKRTLCTGSSDPILVTEGENQLTLKLKKSETTTVEEEEEGEPPITYIDIYVSATGNDDEGDGLTLYTAFKTINRACEEIIAVGQSEEHYKILVSGNCTPTEPTIIPDSLTTEHAKTIVIAGANGVDADGIPQDVLDRGKADSVNAVTDGDVLRVNTSVPLTITNLKITGGYGGGTKAGGMNISKVSTVSLGNGVLITKNRNPSSGRGGGIHNEGTLYIYGTAVIGDKTNGGKSLESDYVSASSYSSTYGFSNCANVASTGGAIYNGSDVDSTVSAKLYLGYKRASNGNPVKEELTGGLYFNFGTGGALYNATGNKVYIDSGTIAWNASSSLGGAVYNDAGARFEMTGGTIRKNELRANSDANGGGVYNMGPGKFIFSGGLITQNEAKSASGGAGHGAGVWNGGYMFVYGTASIGDSTTGNEGALGAGIYNDGYDFGSINTANEGRVYIGYRPDTDETSPILADFTGGIYHNYAVGSSTSDSIGGGAIWSSGTLKIASGTISNNTAYKSGGAINASYSANTEFEISGGTISDNSLQSAGGGHGGAIYMSGSSSLHLVLKGNLDIPAGSDGKHDIYLDGSSTVHSLVSIGGPLTTTEIIRITPADYSSTSATMLLLPEGVTDTTIAKEAGKFTITPQTDSNGKTVIWKVKSYGANSGTLSKLEVGDIVFNDGTAVGYHNDLSLSATQKAKAIAVIYNTAYYDSSLTPRTLGVSLKQQSNLAWCSGSAKAAFVKITSIVCNQPGGVGYQSTDYVVGSNALSAISTYLTEHDPYISDTAAVTLADNYPAFNFAENFSGISGNNVYGTDFSSGWYLPTPKEFTLICDNSDTVINAFGKCGATFFENTYYWTCAQYTADSQADLIYFPLGVFNAESKSSLHNVLAIREF